MTLKNLLKGKIPVGLSIEEATVNEKTILENLTKAREVYKENKELRNLLEEIADLSHSLMWAKDLDCCYLYANKIHCTKFFGLPSECNQFVIGRSDIDLINDFMERTGKNHTFGTTCVNTDHHCLEQGVACLYNEIGWVGEQLLVLSVRKSPRFNNNGKIIGTVGLGIDVTHKCEIVLLELENGMKSGDVEQLEPGVFWVKNRHKNCPVLVPGELPSFREKGVRYIRGNVKSQNP